MQRFTVDRRKFVIIVQFAKGRENVGKGGFKGITFISGTSGVIKLYLVRAAHQGCPGLWPPELYPFANRGLTGLLLLHKLGVRENHLGRTANFTITLHMHQNKNNTTLLLISNII